MFYRAANAPESGHWQMFQSCQSVLRLDAEHEGKQARCPVCGVVTLVSSQSEAGDQEPEEKKEPASWSRPASEKSKLGSESSPPTSAYDFQSPVSDFGPNVGRERLQHTLRKGHAQVRLLGERVEIAPYLKKAADKVGPIVTTRLRESLRKENASADLVLLVGGGSGFFEEAIKEAFYRQSGKASSPFKF